MTVQLPPSWPSKCLVAGGDRRIASVPASGMAEPDVAVVRESLVQRGRPWTEQHGGCGVNGIRIHVPREFFDFDSDDRSALGSRGMRR